VINGVTYDHTASVNGAVVYLQQGTQTYTVQKFQINNTNSQPYDVGLGFQPPGSGQPLTVPPDHYVVAYYTGGSENLNVSVLNGPTTTSTFESFNVQVGTSTVNVHLATDGNLYTLNAPQNTKTTATYTPQAITPFLANGVKVDRTVTISTTDNTVSQNFYVAADNSKLIPATLISQTQGATSENLNLDTSTASTQSFSVGGVDLRLGADGNFYGVQLDPTGNLVVTATYTPAQIPQTVVDGVNVIRQITVGTQSYFVASDNSQLILKSYPATSQNATIATGSTATGSTTTSTLTEAFTVQSSTGAVNLNYATNGNFYTLKPTKDANGNYQIDTTYPPTPINPFQLANGVMVNRTIQIGSQYFYVAADNSQIVPEPAHPAQNEIFPTNSAVTNSPVTAATTTSITQSIAFSGVPGGKIYIGSDQNLYALQVDASGHEIGTTYPAASIVPTTVDGVNVNRTITVGTQSYFVASDNSQLILKSYPATSQNATIATGSTTTSTLTEAFTVQTRTSTGTVNAVNLNYATNGNFYTLQPTKDANGNYQIDTTYTTTPINPVVLANGVLVNRTIQIGTQYFYVAADNSQIVPEPVHPGQNEVSSSAVTTTNKTLKQAYTIPGVPGQLHYASDNNFYSLQVDATGNPVLDAQNRDQIIATYTPTDIPNTPPPIPVAGVRCDRMLTIPVVDAAGRSVGNKVYYVGVNDPTTGAPSALVPQDLQSQTLPTATGSGTIATTTTLTPAYPVPGIPFGIYSSPDGKFYSLKVDNNGNPVKDANGNDLIDKTYPVTQIPQTTVNGVSVNGTITVVVNGLTNTYYVTTDGSHLVPAAVTNSPVTAATTTSITQSMAFSGVPGGKLYIGSDQNLYALQVDASGQLVKDTNGNYEIGTTYPAASIVPTTVDGVNVNRTITVGGKIYYVAADNSELIPADLPSQTLPTTTGSGTIAITTTLTPAYPVPGIPLGFYSSPDGKFYSLQVDNNGNPVKDANGNDLIGDTYPVTRIPQTTVNGVSVNGTIKVVVNGLTNTYYVTTDGRHLVPAGLTLEQEYALPAVPGGVHLASDGNFYSLQLDSNGNPILNAQNQYQLGPAYTLTNIVPPMPVAGIMVDRSVSVGGQTYDVAQDNSQLIPDTLASGVVSGTPTATANIPTTAALTQSYSVPNSSGKSQSVHYSSNGNFYTVKIDSTTGKPLLDANGNYEVDTTIVPTEITPTTVNGINVDRTVTIGSTTYYVATDNSQLVLPVTTPPTVIPAPAVRNMDVMEFIYYWNEAKMHVLKSQLAYQNDITQLMQESLRQANAAMADLEQQSSQVKQSDTSSGTQNPNSSAQTVAFHLFAIENQTETTTTDTSTNTTTTVGSIMPVFFGIDGKNPDNTDLSKFAAFTLDYGQWQKARVGLQNFIDRRTADAQSAMVDYQNTLNTFNNNYNTMSQLQQALENLLTQELKNWV
jgi:hypothetical protein